MRPRLVTLAASAGCVGLLATGCTSPGRTFSPTAPPASTTSPASRASGPSTAGPAHTSTRAGSPAPDRGTAPPCVTRLAHSLTPAQRVGQLVMIGVDPTTPPATISSVIAGDHVGNIVYLGGWTGSSTVRASSRDIQGRADRAATGDVGMLIAADQEGGQVQQLRGSGFTDEPSALQQGAMDSADRRAVGRRIGLQLKAAGVNLDLAPVADTVPAWLGTGNGPIGRFDREYGHTPARVAAAVTDIIQGLHHGGVLATTKHFPGIGRIRDNTDTSATGITDATFTRTDPELRPFAAGLAAHVDLTMVGFGRYPKVDPHHEAAFSRTIITGILRHQLGDENGVVISDDLNAVAARHIPVGQRAARFIAAGGDIALTGATGNAQEVVRTLAAEVAHDPAFASKVSASVLRVLTLKYRAGLVHCG